LVVPITPVLDGYHLGEAEAGAAMVLLVERDYSSSLALDDEPLRRCLGRAWSAVDIALPGVQPGPSLSLRVGLHYDLP
jgi:hypothetical protein